MECLFQNLTDISCNLYCFGVLCFFVIASYFCFVLLCCILCVIIIIIIIILIIISIIINLINQVLRIIKITVKSDVKTGRI